MMVCWAQANAEDAVRQMLIAFSEEQQLPEVGNVTAEDQMDDGTPIRVTPTLLISSCAPSTLFSSNVHTYQDIHASPSRRGHGLTQPSV